jgi:transposase
MSMAYSEDFKKRVLAYKDSGHTFAQVLEAFGVYHKSYYAWKKQIEMNGKFTPGYHKERKRKIDADKLTKLLEEHPDWYLEQFAEVFHVWPQSIQKRFAQMGITRKKKLLPTAKSLKKKGKHI